MEYSSMNKKYTYLELFAGAGGLLEGFIRNGFVPVSHIEKDRHAVLTLKTRLAYHVLRKAKKIDAYREYIKGNISREQLYSMVPEEIIDAVIKEEIREDNLEHLFKKIEYSMSQMGFDRINVIAGGPPCQAYSLVGRARDPYKMEKDPRNYLYKLYAEFLKRFEPDFFVFENVPGLLNAAEGRLWNDVIEHFEKAGYVVKGERLNAYEFGVLQKRLRVIVIGWRKGLNARYPEFSIDKNVRKYTVNDILDDLPPLKPGERIFHGKYIKSPSEYLLKYNIRKSDDILSLHIARGHNGRDREIYKTAIEKWNRYEERLKYTDLPPEYRTHKNVESFLDRFKVVAANLGYSHTVVAHIAKDGHYYIHPDINQLRSISVREAARLQSFPDDYYFEGPMTAKFSQIGNAVPPLMAERIAAKIREMLE